MNYLSHYFTDYQPGRPHFNAGLILPDLLVRCNRKWRVRKLDLPEEAPLPVQELAMGCNQHQMRDHLFHTSPEFEGEADQLKMALRNNGFRKLPFRASFMGHIIIEMLLDRLLVHDHPELLSSFYGDLEQVADAELLAFGRHADFNAAAFLPYYQRFLEARYLGSYVHNEQFIFALNRIFSRIGHPTIDGPLELVFVEILEATERNLKPRYKRLLG